LPIVETAEGLPARAAIIDGETTVMNEAGLSDFGKLRSAIRWQAGRITLVAFDLLHLDSEDYRKEPVVERKAALERLLGDTTDKADPIQPSRRGRRQSVLRGSRQDGPGRDGLEALLMGSIVAAEQKAG
jgi:ATP-dependent DNA ligase